MSNFFDIIKTVVAPARAPKPHQSPRLEQVPVFHGIQLALGLDYLVRGRVGLRLSPSHGLDEIKTPA